MKKTPEIKPFERDRHQDGSFFIFHTPSWEKVHADFAAHSQWSEVQKSLNEKRYTVKDTDVTYRTINSWSEEGLFHDARENNSGWRKLSFKDVAWLRILRILREYGLPLEKLKASYQTLIPAYSVDFEAGLALCFQNPSTPVFVIVFHDGTTEIATLHSLHATDFLVGYDLPYIRINLNTICCDLIGNDSLMPPRTLALELLEEERDALYALRKSGADEIQLRMKEGQIEEIKSVKVHKGAERIAEIIQDMNFGEITVSVQNGKPAHTKTTHKKRTKK